MADIFVRGDLWVIGIYMATMLLVGFWVSKSSRDVEGYALGNRSMTSWVLGLSVLGTFTSSITFLSLPAKAFQSNWNVFVFGMALPLAAWIGTRYFVPLYRREIQLSAFELLDARFGYWARLYANISYIVLQMIRTATIMLLVAMAMHTTLGTPIVETLIVSGVVVIIYDAFGGIQADIWTDVVQVFVFVLGAGWALAVLLSDAGGPSQFFAQLPAERFSLGELATLDWSTSAVWVVFLYGLSENLRNYGTDQNYVQRILCADSERSAKNSIWIGALAYLPVSAIFCLIGTGLWLHYGGERTLPEGIKAEDVFPYFMRTELPPAVLGLVMSGIMAAAMSTIDSAFNSISTLMLVDVIRPLRGDRPPRIPEIWSLRLVTALFGVLGTCTAIFMYLQFKEERARIIMDLWWQYAGTAGGGLFGLFLLAWLMPRLPAWGAALGVIITIPVLAWGTFLRNLPADSPWAWLNCPLHPNLVGISATVALLLEAGMVMLLVKLGLVAPNPRTAQTA
jgi:SSS family solute:Na+ symporter